MKHESSCPFKNLIPAEHCWICEFARAMDMQPIPENAGRDRGCHTCRYLSPKPVSDPYLSNEKQYIWHLCQWLGPMPEWLLMDGVNPTSVDSGHRRCHVPLNGEWPENQVRWSGDRCVTWEKK
jgi:hypothetical protein